MNLIDIAFLKSFNITENKEGTYLRYERRKTISEDGVKEFNIKLPDTAKEILSYYLTDKEPDELIFPLLQDIIDHPDAKEVYRVYCYRRTNHNTWLKRIGEDAETSVKLTTYVARHSFATIGLYNDIPIRAPL